MDLFKKCYDYDRVKLLKEVELYPYFHAAQSGQDTEMIMEGKKTIMIGIMFFIASYVGLLYSKNVYTFVFYYFCFAVWARIAFPIVNQQFLLKHTCNTINGCISMNCSASSLNGFF